MRLPKFRRSREPHELSPRSDTANAAWSNWVRKIGQLTSFVLELVVYPALYEIWKWHFGLKREPALAPAQVPLGNPRSA